MYQSTLYVAALLLGLPIIIGRLQSTLHVPALLPGRPSLHPPHHLLLLLPLLHLHRCHLGGGGASSQFDLLFSSSTARCSSTRLTRLSASLEELLAFSLDSPSSLFGIACHLLEQHMRSGKETCQKVLSRTKIANIFGCPLTIKFAKSVRFLALSDSHLTKVV